MVRSLLKGALVGAAFLLGFFLGHRTSDSNSSPQVKPTDESSRQKHLARAKEEEIDGVLKTKIQDLEQQLEEEKGNREAAILTDRAKFYKDHRDMFILVHPFDFDLKLCSSMIDYLNLNDTERRALEQHLLQVLAENQQIQQLKMQTTNLPNGAIRYKIPTYPEGAAIKTELKNFMVRDIGPDRAEALFSSATSEFEWCYSGFGEDETTIYVSRIDAKGPPVYEVQEQVNGRLGDRGQSTDHVTTEFPVRLRGLFQIDPSPQ